MFIECIRLLGMIIGGCCHLCRIFKEPKDKHGLITGLQQEEPNGEVPGREPVVMENLPYPPLRNTYRQCTTPVDSGI